MKTALYNNINKMIYVINNKKSLDILIIMEILVDINEAMLDL